MTLDSGAPEHRVGVDAEWDRKLVLEKMKLDHELARYGLRGTLFGTFAALATMVIIFIAQVSTGRNVVFLESCLRWSYTELSFTRVLLR